MLSPLWLSLKIATVATIITFILGIFVAYCLFNYHGKWKPLLEGILLTPLILPPTVVGFFLLQLLGRYGLLGRVLALLQINVIFTQYAGIIAAVVVTFPLMYKTASGAYEQIDQTLLEAARTLGAGEKEVFYKIALPLALPGILAGAVLSFARGLGEFGATLMVAGNIPGVTQTLPLAIYSAVETGDFQTAWFWSGIILSVSCSAIALLHYFPSFFQPPPQEKKAKPQPSQPLSLSKTGDLSVLLEKQFTDFTLQVSFTVKQGKPLAILGASGAGKSLILRCLAGMENPTIGRILNGDRVLFDSERGVNVASCDRKIGILLQHYALFPHLTVAENIAFGLPKTLSSQAVQQQVQQYLKTIQLEGMGKHYPKQLSGGQQQRVALARVLASQPDILLLDEPFSALDTHIRSQTEQELRSLLTDYHGITILVTHNRSEAYRICEDLLIIEQGRITAWGDKHDIFHNPKTLGVAQLTGCKNFSPVYHITPYTLNATAWNCTLQTHQPLSQDITAIGIRAYELGATLHPQKFTGENVFPCWVTTFQESPHRITLYLTLNPQQQNPYPLQAEILKSQWRKLQPYPFPWFIQFPPESILKLTQ